MGYWKVRLFAVAITLASAALVYVNWQELINEGTYSFRLAALAPIGVIGGIFLLLFPSKIGRPETTMDKIIVFIMFAIGVAAGIYNLHLMDPGFFKF